MTTQQLWTNVQHSVARLEQYELGQIAWTQAKPHVTRLAACVGELHKRGDQGRFES
jgi:hypothetical protein